METLIKNNLNDIIEELKKGKLTEINETDTSQIFSRIETELKEFQLELTRKKKIPK